MEITAYHTVKLTASAHHGGTSHWVEITVTEDSGSRFVESKSGDITLFFNSAALADAYAAAINGVDHENPEAPTAPAVQPEEEISF